MLSFGVKLVAYNLNFKVLLLVLHLIAFVNRKRYLGTAFVCLSKVFFFCFIEVFLSFNLIWVCWHKCRHFENKTLSLSFRFFLVCYIFFSLSSFFFSFLFVQNHCMFFISQIQGFDANLHEKNIFIFLP